MPARTVYALGFAASLLGCFSEADAQQRTNFGQQMQQQLLNNVNSRITGQPAYPTPNQGYNTQNPSFPYGNQGYPSQNPAYNYQVQRPAFGQPGYAQQPQQGAFSNPSTPGYGQQTLAQQRYQLPVQYGGYPAGSTVTYGGATYVVNADRTMSPATTAQPAPVVQRYQIPTQFAGTAPGSTVNYGGRNYAINNDGTMSPLAR